MKRFKIWSMMMLAVMMMPMVASCGDDDDDNGGGSNSFLVGEWQECKPNGVLKTTLPIMKLCICDFVLMELVIGGL